MQARNIDLREVDSHDSVRQKNQLHRDEGGSGRKLSPFSN